MYISSADRPIVGAKHPLRYLRIGGRPKLAGMYTFTVHTNTTRLYIFCPSENKEGLAALGSWPIKLHSVSVLVAYSRRTLHQLIF